MRSFVMRLAKGIFVICLLVVTCSTEYNSGQVTVAYAAGSVTNCVYSGSGGLADALAGGGTVTFACSGTIAVPQIMLTTDTTLDATGQTVVLSGNNANRVFWITAGVTAIFINLTITAGNGLPSPGSGGGGILNLGTLTLINSTVAGNTSQFNGGGVNNQGTLNLIGTTISGNTNVNSGGGGLENSGTITLTNSTISGNTAAIEGGGIRHITGTVTLINSTVISNTAPTGQGGGIASYGGMVTLTNSIVAYNGGSGNCQSRYGGLLISQGHSISSDATCSFSAVGDINEQDPLLGPLQNNGGLTFTHALLSGSPAINAGDNAACPSTDQRGVTRPQAGVCDMGAYEFVFPYSILLPLVLRNP